MNMDSLDGSVVLLVPVKERPPSALKPNPVRFNGMSAPTRTPINNPDASNIGTKSPVRSIKPEARPAPTPRNG